MQVPTMNGGTTEVGFPWILFALPPIHASSFLLPPPLLLHDTLLGGLSSQWMSEYSPFPSANDGLC